MLQRGLILADSAPPDAVSVSARPAMLFMIARVLKEVVASVRSFYKEGRAEKVTARWRLSIYTYDEVDTSGVMPRWRHLDLQDFDCKGLICEVKQQAEHDKQASTCCLHVHDAPGLLRRHTLTEWGH